MKLSSDKLLLPSSVHLWVCKPDTLAIDAMYRLAMESLLDEVELARMHRFKYERHALQFCISHAFTRDVLANYCGVSAADIRFQKNRHGKPFIANVGASHIQFSLSHTQGMQLLAVGNNQPLGCDVEWRSGKVRGPEIAGRFFSALEVERLSAQADDAQAFQFFDYWSLKESFIKAKGMGLALPLGAFSFLIAAKPTDALNAKAGQCVAVRNATVATESQLREHDPSWQFRLIDLSVEHSVALAFYNQDSINIDVFETNPLQSSAQL